MISTVVWLFYLLSACDLTWAWDTGHLHLQMHIGSTGHRFTSYDKSIDVDYGYAMVFLHGDYVVRSCHACPDVVKGSVEFEFLKEQEDYLHKVRSAYDYVEAPIVLTYDFVFVGDKLSWHTVEFVHDKCKSIFNSKTHAMNHTGSCTSSKSYDLKGTGIERIYANSESLYRSWSKAFVEIQELNKASNLAIKFAYEVHDGVNYTVCSLLTPAPIQNEVMLIGRGVKTVFGHTHRLHNYTFAAVRNVTYSKNVACSIYTYTGYLALLGEHVPHYVPMEMATLIDIYPNMVFKVDASPTARIGRIYNDLIDDVDPESLEESVVLQKIKNDSLREDRRTGEKAYSIMTAQRSRVMKLTKSSTTRPKRETPRERQPYYTPPFVYMPSPKTYARSRPEPLRTVDVLDDTVTPYDLVAETPGYKNVKHNPLDRDRDASSGGGIEGIVIFIIVVSLVVLIVVKRRSIIEFILARCDSIKNYKSLP
uniref:Membrane protein a157 n=1 Tax=Mastomys natalensis cytomegalovirus 2 TaxID=2973540 RepID=A0A9Y1IQH4_9BETA|nr:membrane protein a157 [Mastomys natalensis cytomegalovirus 2]WEG69283.1 membrane protein a157 [Mastomys natalensis cytomegalovirus 2]WEG69422.1 membrane protein a157 [Mastomys natalensis cytomegalovirus 2]WEG69560.1 membrane protein a157 [Mastomys natalensis cytomegalovirus 2]WEG69698.1 membrane protein a157 [Mastomys natalensis cytomegalovirus 2]